MLSTLPETLPSEQLTLLDEPSTPLSLHERQVLEALLVRTKTRLERAEGWRTKAVHECIELRRRVAKLIQQLNR
jgi:hypothetical protein